VRLVGASGMAHGVARAARMDIMHSTSRGHRGKVLSKKT
jgi:hypothetical protein